MIREEVDEEDEECEDEVEEMEVIFISLHTPIITP